MQCVEQNFLLTVILSVCQFVGGEEHERGTQTDRKV